MYKVYRHTCPNGKIYIGITSQADINRRWQNGYGYHNNVLFYRAIKKYGWNNIRHEILFDRLSKSQAEDKEIQLIRELKSDNPQYGYNIENGGNCTGTHSEETKRKISAAQIGEKITLTGSRPHCAVENVPKNKLREIGLHILGKNRFGKAKKCHSKQLKKCESLRQKRIRSA